MSKPQINKDFKENWRSYKIPIVKTETPLEILENICILQCKEKEINDELLSLHEKLADLKNLISQKEEIQKKIAQIDQKQIEQEILDKKSKNRKYKQSLQIFKARHWDSLDLSKIELKIEQWFLWAFSDESLKRYIQLRKNLSNKNFVRETKRHFKYVYIWNDPREE